MARGGKRKGAGRPFGTKKEPTVIIQRRVKKEWIPIIDELIKKLRNNEDVQVKSIVYCKKARCYCSNNNMCNDCKYNNESNE